MKPYPMYSAAVVGALPALCKNLSRLALAAVLGLVPASPVTASETDGARSDTLGFTNRLIHSRNPYLLLHAHNPVDWYPWGPEAFARAKAENKPVFVSIGYSTCFWCHVAERTIYSNPEIAALMNRWFINVKVDREQRPDVDRVYLLATQLITGRGGWPNNLFLTHEGKPFFAGSYFPPEDDPQRGAGFPTILKAIHEAWQNRRQELEQAANSVAAALHQAQAEVTAWVVTPVRPRVLLKKAARALLNRFDATWGGIPEPVSGAKFPRTPQLAMLLTDYRIHQDRDSLTAVQRTLRSISQGGIHDHLGGGFHRYSVESTWSVPHFEKMLYDNAQLLRLYAEAFQITGESIYRLMALETGEYIRRDMMSPEGGFYTARDAQIDGVEGETYLWTPGQIAAVLGDDAAARFLRAYSVVPLPHPDVSGIQRPADIDGEQPGVLRLRHPVEDALKSAGFKDLSRMLEAFGVDRAKLLAAREQRRQPARDEKILVSLNGLAIAALAESAKTLGEPRFLSWAEKAAERIWSLAYDSRSGLLNREIYLGKAQTDGFLEDYALLGQALLSLARTTGNPTWRERASGLRESMTSRFVRGDGSLSMTPYEIGLAIPVPGDRDFDLPSATSAALDFLLQVNAGDKNPGVAETTALIMNRLSGQLDALPDAWSSAIAAINRHPLPDGVIVKSTEEPAAGGTSSSVAVSIPATSDHVSVAASVVTQGDRDEIHVKMVVADGYHINANPASFDYLIPTSIEFERLKPSEIRYPPSTRFAPEFAPEGLDVYEGTVEIVATFPKGDIEGRRAVRGSVRAQACDDRVCLPPSSVQFTVGDGPKSTP